MAVAVLSKTLQRTSTDIPWPPETEEADAHYQTNYIDKGLLLGSTIKDSADGLSRNRKFSWFMESLDNGNVIQQLLRADDTLYQNYIDMSTYCKENNITIGDLNVEIYDNEHNLVYSTVIPNELIF